MKSYARVFPTGLLVLILASSAGVIVAAEPDFSKVPGVVIAHSPASSKIYIGSPSITILPDGTYLATHDRFGPGSTGQKFSLYVYRSTDRGKTWEPLAQLKQQHWTNIFCHQGAVYLMGASNARKPGCCIIRKSTDGGKTWTEPKDENSGVLLSDFAYHTAPTPMCYHDGRIWRAMEDQGSGGGWGHRFRTFMMSAPVDADLLKASSWTSSNVIARDPSYFDGQFRGWLEGNAVCDPSGQMLNLLRVNYEKGSRISGKAAIVHVSKDGKTSTFDPKTGFIDLPGGAKKFTIRYDEKTKAYWTLTNPVVGPLDRNAGSVRNTLALLRSKDLIHWEIRCILLQHPDVVKHGFQYPDWVFDGDDIVAAIRTGYDDGLGGAHNAHDANFLTFHRFANFRELTPKDSVKSAK